MRRVTAVFLMSVAASCTPQLALLSPGLDVPSADTADASRGDTSSERPAVDDVGHDVLQPADRPPSVDGPLVDAAPADAPEVDALAVDAPSADAPPMLDLPSIDAPDAATPADVPSPDVEVPRDASSEPGGDAPDVPLADVVAPTDGGDAGGCNVLGTWRGPSWVTTFGSDGRWITPGAFSTTSGRYAYTGRELSFSESSSPRCADDRVTYSVAFSADCNRMTLRVSFDGCGGPVGGETLYTRGP